jgi:hypothetical protein
MQGTICIVAFVTKFVLADACNMITACIFLNYELAIWTSSELEDILEECNFLHVALSLMLFAETFQAKSFIADCALKGIALIDNIPLTLLGRASPEIGVM